MMRVEILYPHVVSASDPESKGPEFFATYHKRFIESYLRFPSGVEHRLGIVFCGNPGQASDNDLEMYETAMRFTNYPGGGWDIGCHQEIASKADCDIAVCLVTPTYFREDNWLVPIVETFEKYGDGLYGTSASYQGAPHIRTGCFALSPATMRKYPWKVDSRADGLLFESGIAPGRVYLERGFTNWMLSQGKPVKLVTREGCYDLPEWRNSANIFRRGDQSNALAWDRHFDIYAAAGNAEKSVLEKLADG